MSQSRFADLKYCRELAGLFPEVENWWLILDAEGKITTRIVSKSYAKQIDIQNTGFTLYPAPDTDDLLKVLPSNVHVFKQEKGYASYRSTNIRRERKFINGNTASNVLAQMAIYLKDNGLLKGE